MQKRRKLIMSLVVLVAILLVSSESLLAQELANCTLCHNDTTLITGKQTGLSEAVHGTGEAYVRGTSSGCAGCHSGGGFSQMVTDGLTPDTVQQGDPNPTRQDCRTCHQIHTSMTEADWALETTDPVTLYAFDGIIYDGGKGNLCANCHQPRRTFEEYIQTNDPNDPEDDTVNVSNTHWGPHHGPQSAMIVGKGGAGVEGNKGAHGFLVNNTCVDCHIGENASHTFEPVEASCEKCHDENLEDDLDALQGEVEDKIETLRDLLLAKGILEAETEYEINEDGEIEAVIAGYEPVPAIYSAAEAEALWNYIFIAVEDGSLGVHNPTYTKDLLDASIAALQ